MPAAVIFRCEPLSRIVERLALIVLLVGGLGMLFSMFLGVADIVGTQVLLIPVPGPRELTESTMVLIVFGALAYAQIGVPISASNCFISKCHRAAAQ